MTGGGWSIYLGSCCIRPISKYKPYVPNENTLLYIDWCGNCSWCFVSWGWTTFCCKQTATDLVCNGNYLSCLCMFYRYVCWNTYTYGYPNFTWMWIYTWGVSWTFYPYTLMKWTCTSDSYIWNIHRILYNGCIESRAWYTCKTFKCGLWWRAFIAKVMSWSWANAFSSTVSTPMWRYSWGTCCIYSCDPWNCYRFRISSPKIWEVIVENKQRTGAMIDEYVENTKSKYWW